jgi:hypothetical protein
MAEPSVKTIKALSKTSRTMIGTSHHFFRIFKKPQNSNKIESFDILLSSLMILNPARC